MSNIQAVRMREVVKSYGDFRALNHLNLTVDLGSCVALLGPNGAGKTTAMRILTGQLTVDQGAVEVFNEPLSRGGASLRARIGLVPQNDNLEVELTVYDNLDIFARLYGIGRARRGVNVARALAVTELESHSKRRVQTLSGGYRRRVLIARALVSEPELLILDEPTVGLDPEVRFTILDTLGKLKTAGLSIVVASHYLDELSQLIDDVVIIRDGEVLRSSSMDDFRMSFAAYRSVHMQGADVASLHRSASDSARRAISLSKGGDGSRYVMHSDLVSSDLPSRPLTFSEMYLATLAVS